MTYPELDLIAALDGAPVAWIAELMSVEKVWLHHSKIDDNKFYIEFDRKPMVATTRNEVARNARMWVEPVVFEHWDLIDERLTKLEKSSLATWYFWFNDAGKGKSIQQDTFIDGFFPDCPIGTVIKRPEVTA